jgi:hypothetical protein
MTEKQMLEQQHNSDKMLIDTTSSPNAAKPLVSGRAVKLENKL